MTNNIQFFNILAIGLLMDATSISRAFLYVGIVFTVISIISIKIYKINFAIDKTV